MESVFKLGDIVTPSHRCNDWLDEAYGAQGRVIKVYHTGEIDVRLLTRIIDGKRGDVIPGYVWKEMYPNDFDLVSHGEGVYFISLL